MPRRIIDFVRHGAYDGDEGLLTPRGVAQVELLAARYRAEGGPTEIWASPMPRARHTGDILARALDLKPRSVADLAEGIPTAGGPVAEAWPDLGEDQLSATRARFERVLERINKRARGSHKHLVLACHGNVARYLWLRILGLSDPTWWAMHIHHASLSRVIVGRRGVRAVRFNDIGHLPPALQSES